MLIPTPSPSPDLQAVVLRAFPGSQIESCEELRGGVSCRAVLARLRLAGGATRNVVVRRPHRDTVEEARRVVSWEYKVLGHCAELGIAVPPPCFLDAPAAALVLDYLPGAPELNPPDEGEMLRQMAGQLALIHRVEPDPALALLRHRKDGAGKRIREWPERLDESLQESALRDRLSRLWPWPQHNPDRLLHGDYWPGNLLWREHQLVAVLDWEDTKRGDPLADVAIARLELAWAFGFEAMERFTRLYREQTALDWRNLARWDLYAALRPMGELARWAASFPLPPLSRPDVTEATMREAHRRFVALALQRLDAGTD
jgi:aminoglycoside phosphotransferase (APT) family kinase protein